MSLELLIYLTGFLPSLSAFLKCLGLFSTLVGSVMIIAGLDSEMNITKPQFLVKGRRFFIGAIICFFTAITIPSAQTMNRLIVVRATKQIIALKGVQGLAKDSVEAVQLTLQKYTNQLKKESEKVTDVVK